MDEAKVRKVAEAMFAAASARHPFEWASCNGGLDYVTLDGQFDFLEIARAALRAATEP